MENSEYIAFLKEMINKAKAAQTNEELDFLTNQYELVRALEQAVYVNEE